MLTGDLSRVFPAFSPLTYKHKRCNKKTVHLFFEEIESLTFLIRLTFHNVDESHLYLDKTFKQSNRGITTCMKKSP